MSRTILFLLGALGLADLALSGALVFLSLRRPIYYVGTHGSGTADPAEIPESSVRALALDYLWTFENFTPATVDRSLDHVKTLVSPAHYHSVSDMLSRRRSLVSEGRISSLLSLDPASVRVRFSSGRYEVSLDGVKKLFLSDKLSSRLRVRYEISIEPSPATAVNPLGLYVCGQKTQETLYED